MSETTPATATTPATTDTGGLAAGLFSNKKTNGLVALIIAAALGTPISIFATKDDVRTLANKDDVVTLQAKVEELNSRVENMETHLKAALDTGKKLTRVIEDDLSPNLRRLATAEEIRKALQIEREKRANTVNRATIGSP